MPKSNSNNGKIKYRIIICCPEEIITPYITTSMAHEFATRVVQNFNKNLYEGGKPPIATLIALKDIETDGKTFVHAIITNPRVFVFTGTLKNASDAAQNKLTELIQKNEVFGHEPYLVSVVPLDKADNFGVDVVGDLK